MSLENCVNELYEINSNYRFPEQAANQASSLRALSTDLYTDPIRFLYELIQNADDADSSTIRISFFGKHFLAIGHNGKPFNDIDVRSLCAIGNSSKTRCLHSTGYKGLGFKAVFGRSQYVAILSNDECFRFDASHDFTWRWPNINRATWEQIHDRKFIYPWHLCPIWTDQRKLPSPIRDWLRSNAKTYKVIIILRLENPGEMSVAIQEFQEHPHMFLFLRHIRDVDISNGSKPPVNILQERQSNKSVKLFCNNRLFSQWLVVQRSIKVPSEKIFEDTHLPEKLRHIKITELAFAAQIDPEHGKRIIPIDDKKSFLFAYIPTKISDYSFSLLINGNFITNANREQIHADSSWNQNLFAAIPHEIIKMDKRAS